MYNEIYVRVAMHGSELKACMEPYHLIIHARILFLRFMSIQGIKISLLKNLLNVNIRPLKFYLRCLVNYSSNYRVSEILSM